MTRIAQPSLDEREAVATQNTAVLMTTELALSSRAINVLFEGFSLLEGTSIRRRWWDAVFRLLSRAFNSLLLSAELLRRGYPVQAQALTRAAYEHFLAAAYVQKNPKSARFWLARKYANDKFRREIPSFDRMHREIHGTVAKNADDSYAILSQLSHPRPAGIRLTWRVIGLAFDFEVGARFNAAQAFLAYYLLIPTITDCVSVLGAFLHGRDPLWEQRASELWRDTTSWLDAADEKVIAGGLASAIPGWRPQ